MVLNRFKTTKINASQTVIRPIVVQKHQSLHKAQKDSKTIGDNNIVV
jgi:hypothetical protein